MTAKGRIHWKVIVLAALFAEATVLAIFFLLLFAASAAGVPEIAKPMSTLDNIDAMVSSFVTMLLFTLWAGNRIETAFVVHGVLIGAFGVLLFGIMWVATTGSLLQPAPYVVAHVLKVLGGATGGLIAGKRRQRVLASTGARARG